MAFQRSLSDCFEKQRSKLLTLKVNIRKVTRYETETNPAGVSELYEVWGWSESTKSWLYVFVTPELPPGLSADTLSINRRRSSAISSKMQGYYPALAKPNAKPTLAPMMIENLSCRSQSLLLHRNQLHRSKSSLEQSSSSGYRVDWSAYFCIQNEEASA